MARAGTKVDKNHSAFVCLSSQRESGMLNRRGHNWARRQFFEQRLNRTHLIDKYNNTYLVTSNGSMLFISSISIENYKEDIDYLFTDLSLDHSGKFPLLDTREINFEIKNNQINATYVFDEIFTFNSNLFIPRFK